MNTKPTTLLITKTHPTPQGSKRHVGKGRLVEQTSTRLKQWRNHVTVEARQTRRHYTGPIAVSITFRLPRPQAHQYTDGTLRAKAPTRPYPAKRGDIDKLCRSTLDALTDSGIINDDAQVVELYAVVEYQPTTTRDAATTITLTPLFD